MMQLLNRYLMAMGINLRHTVKFFPNFIKYFSNFLKLKIKEDKNFKISLNYPCLYDWSDNSGVASGHYFHQDLVIAQEIFSRNPILHVDIASRVDGFVAHVASFRKIEVFDIRNLNSSHENIRFTKMDLLNPVDNLINYTDSLSCLHAIEHFGLGRYGDPLDMNGYITGFKNISKILKTGGILYLSVPTGRQRIEFNAHRVFHTETILKLVESDYELLSFSYVDDVGNLHRKIDLNDVNMKICNSMKYGCGIYILKKRS